MADETRERVVDIPVVVVEERETPPEHAGEDATLTQDELDKLLEEESRRPVVPARKGARLRARRAWASALLESLCNFVNRILGRS